MFSLGFSPHSHLAGIIDRTFRLKIKKKLKGETENEKERGTSAVEVKVCEGNQLARVCGNLTINTLTLMLSNRSRITAYKVKIWTIKLLQRSTK